MVSFSSFRQLDPESADLALELIEAATRERSPFASFMNLWMGFNRWMECITDAASDAAMINALAGHHRLVSAYDALFAASPDFQAAVDDFAANVAGFEREGCQAKAGTRCLLAIPWSG